MLTHAHTMAKKINCLVSIHRVCSIKGNVIGVLPEAVQTNAVAANWPYSLCRLVLEAKPKEEVD